MTDTTETPKGELTLRTVAMPADMNGNGDILIAASSRRFFMRQFPESSVPTMA